MKNSLLSILIVFVSSPVLHAGIRRYVKASATGANSGNSWTDAYTDFQNAINSSTAGDTLFVAFGNYQPLSGQSFNMKEGVKIYGHFAGTETNLSQRNLNSTDTSKLTGNGNSVMRNDNNGLTAATILDGFTLTGGNAGSNNGGGMYNYQASPIINNCIFSNNSTNSSTSLSFNGGGGMYNDFSSPTISNCTFIGNAVNDPGTGNTHALGGGMYNYNSSPVLNNCTFSNNTLASHDCDGSGMYNNDATPTITNCSFLGNTMTGVTCSGGGMFNMNSTPTITNCNFSGNSGAGASSYVNYYVYGSGMYNAGSSPIIDSCIFSNNTMHAGTSGYGGGMYNSGGSPIITNCTFSGNVSHGNNIAYGGGMYNNNASPILNHCTFSNDTAYVNGVGGAVYNYNASPNMSGCIFSTNYAAYDGGAMHNDTHSSPHLSNCIFSKNTSNNGGAIYDNYYSSPVITNCVFFDNNAVYGEGLSNSSSSSLPSISNSILWDGANEVYNVSSTPVITYSDIQGGYSGVGNISTYPMFVDTVNNNLHLSCSSPCINTGNNDSVINLSITVDFDSNSRIQGGTVDMGAYEFNSTGAAPNAPAFANTNNTICLGSTIPTLTAIVATGQTVDWYNAATGGTLLLSGSISFTPSVAGVYFAQARDTSTGCTSATRTADTVIISTPPSAPAITVSNNSICSGSTIPTLTATVGTGVTVDWYNAATGGTLLSSGNTSYTPTIAGVYFAEARNITTGCTSTTRTSDTLIINPLPSAPSITNSNNTICSGSTIPTLTAIVGAGVTVDWYNAATGGTLLLSGNTNYTPTIAGVYFAEARNIITGCISTTRTADTLIINPLPTAPTLTNNIFTICSGSTIPTFTAIVGSGETVDWYNAANGGALLLSGNTNFTPTTSGVFFAEARNTTTGCVSALRTADTLIINPLPSAPIISNTNITICSGSTIPTLIATVGSGETIDWYNSASGGTLLLSGNTNYTPTTTGVYYAEARNITTGCISGSRTADTLIINPMPAAPTIVNTNNTICSNSPIPVLIANVGSGETVDWYNTASGGSLLLSGNVNFTPSTAGVYFAEARNISAGCTSLSRTADTLIIIPQPAPPIVISPITYTQGAVASPLTATASPNNSLLWYTTATGGTGGNIAPTPSTSVADTVYFWVSQIDTTTGCESNRSQIMVIVKYPTSVNNLTSSENDIVIYPNPSNGWIHLTTNNSALINTEMELTDIEGRKLYLWKLKQNNSFDISSLTPGIYLVHFINGQIFKINKQ